MSHFSWVDHAGLGRRRVLGARSVWVGVMGAWAAVLAGCASGPRPPMLGQIYHQATHHDSADRNPVIVIPGVLGSKLVDSPSQAMVWGAFAGGYANPQTARGARMLALPMAMGQPLDQLKDTAVPSGALDRLRVDFLGLPILLDAYMQILMTLGVGGYQDQQLDDVGAIKYDDRHFTCFQFDYDWRRDNVENARRLHQFILDKTKFVQQQTLERYGVANRPVKFDIVAHSMGGLLTRYYVRYGDADLPADGSTPKPTWAGAQHVGRVVLVGTPNAGAIDALGELVHGTKFASILPSVDPAVVGTMPAIYQLLPRPRHKPVLNATTGEPIGDLYDPELWQRMGWGLASPGQAPLLETLLPDIPDPAQRRRVALDHQRKCLARTRQFTAALDQPATPPAGLQIYLFAGDAVDTPARAKVDPRTGKLEISEHAPGDGRVLRSSALLDERIGRAWTPQLETPIAWQQVQFLFTDHLEMTKDPMFTDNMLYVLMEAPRVNPPSRPTPDQTHPD